VAGGHKARQASSVGVTEVQRDDEVSHVLAQHVFTASAKRLLSGGVEFRYSATRVHRNNAIEDGARTRFALAERR
jgi:hypothetical protein